ncbi:MAG: hypothetical protein ACREDR_00040 [Blastocatellia bacterium]
MKGKSKWPWLFTGSVIVGFCVFLLGLLITIPSSAHSATAQVLQPPPVRIIHTSHGEISVYDPHQVEQAAGVLRKTTVQDRTYTSATTAHRSGVSQVPRNGVPVLPLLAGAFPPGSCLLLYGFSRRRREGRREATDVSAIGVNNER